MSIKAYVLINTAIGKTAEVAKTVSRIKGIKKLDVIMGPYDIIIEVEAKDHDELSDVVLTKIQTIKAIRHTMTCPVVKMQEEKKAGKAKSAKA